MMSRSEKRLTRNGPTVACLLAMCRAVAFFRGRDYVLPSDVKYIATDVLHHRIVRTIRAEVENVASDEIVGEVLRHTPIP